MEWSGSDTEPRIEGCGLAPSAPSDTAYGLLRVLCRSRYVDFVL